MVGSVTSGEEKEAEDAMDTVDGGTIKEVTKPGGDTAFAEKIRQREGIGGGGPAGWRMSLVSTWSCWRR